MSTGKAGQQAEQVKAKMAPATPQGMPFWKVRMIKSKARGSGGK